MGFVKIRGTDQSDVSRWLLFPAASWYEMFFWHINLRQKLMDLGDTLNMPSDSNI